MKRLPFLALALLTACSQTAPKTDKDVTPTASNAAALRLPLQIRTAKGWHRFTVEVARTPAEQERGLMFRKALNPDSGMLFPMNPPRTASFWMKDTLIPLDMLFIRTDGSIALIAHNTVPYSREPVSAGVPVAAVLELAGGRAAAIGASEGDRVEWGRCAGGDEKLPDGLEFCPPPAR